MRDLVVCLALEGIPVRISAQILNETFRALLRRKNAAPQRLARTRMLLEQALRNHFVENYEHRVPSLSLPDLGDLHVLAGAIEADARVIATLNLRDFPLRATRPYGVDAVHPDAWLCQLLQEVPALVLRALTSAGSIRTRPPVTPLEIAEAMAQEDKQGTPEFARMLKELLSRAT